MSLPLTKRMVPALRGDRARFGPGFEAVPDLSGAGGAGP